MSENKEIIYTTPEEQVQLLKSKGLKFHDEGKAKAALEAYGYYNIINGYKSPYIQEVNGIKTYKENISFEQIYSLFVLDHNLRNSIMAAMLDLEERLRAAAAEVIAKSFGTDHNIYLNCNNYRDRKTTHRRFGLNGILETLWKNINSDKDPIRYYRTNYGIVPPWILLKGTYFSTLINFIRLFKGTQKAEIISIMYGAPIEESSLLCLKNLFSDTLFICLDYRNLAAHGGRIYNFHSPHEDAIRNNVELYERYSNFSGLKESHGISMLTSLINIFAYRQPGRMIQDSLDKQLQRHLNNYIEDKEYIESVTGLSIYPQTYVWLSTKSNKYHFNSSCSGLEKSIRIRYEDVLENKAYCPCKRCCK